MKVFLSTDIEGTAGIVDWEQVLAGGREYEPAGGCSQDEVNAAIDGAVDAGATAFLVNDAHYTMHNLPPDRAARPGLAALGQAQAAVHDGGAGRLVRRRALHQLPRLDRRPSARCCRTPTTRRRCTRCG